ncbi:MAG TPA: HAD family hydrolase [Candidatus Paceibacterota bacterium]
MVSAVFLDRDGVINEETAYLHDPKNLRLIAGAASAIRKLNEQNVPIIVITNQAGVAKGYYQESEIEMLHSALAEILKTEGAHIDRFYYCPHHPEGKGEYQKVCDCRKPMPGLLLQAAKDFNLEIKRCVFVGDKVSDIGAGVAAGARTILVMTGYGKEVWQSWEQPFQPDHVAADLPDAVEWLLSEPSL